ncbi:MAG TPA: hypothetical protein VK712_04340 [Verrucomicrobiae bacterium]|jgi:hypothetical protein|nr:hypothetical protein [Verrucomicrobiae bacterium]
MNRERRQDTTDDPFWTIVDSTVQTDVMLQVATNDDVVRDAVSLFVCFGPEGASEEEDCRDALERYVVRKYGVSPEHSDRIFNIAEAIIRQEESRYGEA